MNRLMVELDNRGFHAPAWGSLPILLTEAAGTYRVYRAYQSAGEEAQAIKKEAGFRQDVDLWGAPIVG